MDLALTGKRALITGATSGTGAVIATLLAREGASVAIGGRNADRARAVASAIRAAGGQAVEAIGDLDTDEGADACARGAIDAFGGVDILVNNAGSAATPIDPKDADHHDNPTWIAVYRQNTVSAVRLIHRLVPGMKESGWGRVIQVASASALTPSTLPQPFASAKAALINLTVGLSKALAGSGVTVNTISPGLILTPSLQAALDEIGEDPGKSEAMLMKKYGRQTVGRLGRMDDVATMVAWLSSPLADFVNGANIRVDGGASPAIN